MSKTLIQQTAIEKLKRKERERERYFGFRNGEGFVAQAVLDRVELKLHSLQCCVHRWQIRYACRRVHCNLQTTTSTSTSMDEDVDEKEKRERERERDCCGQWRGLEARQCECWTKTSTTPETCLLLLSSPPYLSLSLSKIELYCLISQALIFAMRLWPFIILKSWEMILAGTLVMFPPICFSNDAVSSVLTGHLRRLELQICILVPKL